MYRCPGQALTVAVVALLTTTGKEQSREKGLRNLNTIHVGAHM